MKFQLRLPLYARIVLWFLLNVAVLALAFYLVVRLQFRQGMSTALGSLAGDRIQVLAQDLHFSLAKQTPAEWTKTLQALGAQHEAKIALYHLPDELVAGDVLTIPKEIHEEAQAMFPEPARRGPPGADRPPPRRGPPHRGESLFGDSFLDAFADSEDPPDQMDRPWPARLGLFMKKAEADGLNWVGVRFPPPLRSMVNDGPLILFIVSRSITANGLVFDVKPWLWGFAGALLVSTLLWLPFVRGITHSLRQTMDATELIARGKFDVRVPEDRGDELGRMAQAVNRMAVQLDGYVRGQKRFLGDIAHELCSPIARMEMGLGILDHKLGEEHAENLNDVKEELRDISAMVNELLSFSKAAVGMDSMTPEPVMLRAVIEEVLHTEDLPADLEWVEISDSLIVLAHYDLLKRAIGNVLRNAMLHGAPPIEISAERSNGHVVLSIADSGNGVPADSLPRLFDPFYRVDTARARETGGTGLGLAIVKTCIDACGGTVSAKNVEPHGLEIVITLPRA
jgi:two-component system sensor histidine kinase CpxA